MVIKSGKIQIQVTVYANIELVNTQLWHGHISRTRQDTRVLLVRNRKLAVRMCVSAKSSRPFHVVGVCSTFDPIFVTRNRRDHFFLYFQSRCLLTIQGDQI